MAPPTACTEHFRPIKMIVLSCSFVRYKCRWQFRCDLYIRDCTTAKSRRFLFRHSSYNIVKYLMNLTCQNELRVHFPTRSSERFNFHFGLSLVLDFTVKFSRYQNFRIKWNSNLILGVMRNLIFDKLLRFWSEWQDLI